MLTLVLLPGLDGTGLLFADFAASLGPEVEVIVVSYPPDKPLDYAGLEPIARSFLPKDRPFFLLAESFSGPIGISIAASAPPGLTGLILCCSFARNPIPVLSTFRPALRAISISCVPIGLRGFFLLGRFRSPALLASLKKALARVSEPVLKARLDAALKVDVSEKLSDIRVPLLYLRASEDRVVFRSSSELVLSKCPQARMVQLKAPHFLLQALPSTVATEVTDFMNENTGQKRP